MRADLPANLATASLAAPDYVGDLGDGLIRRWSTAADAAKIGQCLSMVYRSSPDAPANLRAQDEARVYMNTDFPFMGPNDFAIVEDTTRPGAPVVAATCFFRHEWSYAGIRFGVGRPEDVATDPAYRNRGLVRALFAMIHARSAAEGHLVQAITGIPYFYRQFGYEYVLDLEGHRATDLSAVPAKKDDESEPYQLRLATLADVPDLAKLYDQRRVASLVWFEWPEAYWRHLITSWEDPAIQGLPLTQISRSLRLHMIVDGAGKTCGFIWVGAKRWGDALGVFALELCPHVNWQAVAPSLLRALRSLGEAAPGINPDTPPFTNIRWRLGRSHPIYTVLGEALAPHYEAPYAWYLRVPDVIAFLRHITPVLESRLAASPLTGYTGELKLDHYRGGLRFDFRAGKLAAVEPWRPPAYGDEAHAGCPSLIFLQLLFGWRSLAALRAIFPGVWANEPAALLLDILFPAQPSTVYPIA